MYNPLLSSFQPILVYCLLTILEKAWIFVSGISSAEKCSCLRQLRKQLHQQARCLLLLQLLIITLLVLLQRPPLPFPLPLPMPFPLRLPVPETPTISSSSSSTTTASYLVITRSTGKCCSPISCFVDAASSATARRGLLSIARLRQTPDSWRALMSHRS